MSNFMYQCCCPEEVQTCPSSSCPCNSSYTATGIDFTYSFTHNIGTINCATCISQGACRRFDYNMQAAVVQDDPIVVTRRVCPVSGTCGWYGTGTVSVTITATFDEERVCSGALNRSCPQSFSAEVSVPCCIHVTCSTQREGCAGVLVDPGELTYIHKLEICDFTVECWDTYFCGSRSLVTDPCAVIDCDNMLNCDDGPYQVRCIGAHYTWISKYKCLSTISTGDWDRRGFYQNGFRCEPPCTGVVGEATSVLDSNVSQFGPFALHTRDVECNADETDKCQGNLVTGAIAGGHLVGSPTIKDCLRSYCSGCDDTYSFGGVGCPSIDVLQAHSFDRWNYA